MVCSITIVAAGINNLLLDGTKAINGTGNSGAIRCRINVFITGMGAEMIQLPNSLTSRPVGCSRRWLRAQVWEKNLVSIYPLLCRSAIRLLKHSPAAGLAVGN